MQRINVSSSNISSIGYDEHNSILEIEFLSGGIYQYSQVPQSIYNGFMQASSHGSYFHQNIKDVYDFEKIC